jgi:hypothetical protein
VQAQIRSDGEETNHPIVHNRRFGKTHGASHETLNASPQIDTFALNGLRVLFANGMLLGGEMALVGAASIGVKARDTERFQQLFELQKDCILPSPKDVCQHGPTVLINGVPQPPRLRFLAHVTPYLIELRCGSCLLGALCHTTNVHFDLLGMQVLQHLLIHLLEVRFFS